MVGDPGQGRIAADIRKEAPEVRLIWRMELVHRDKELAPIRKPSSPAEQNRICVDNEDPGSVGARHPNQLAELLSDPTPSIMRDDRRNKCAKVGAEQILLSNHTKIWAEYVRNLITEARRCDDGDGGDLVLRS
jgi:hypothetical protein